MTPTPINRPYSIYVSKQLFWSLDTISQGLIGDGKSEPHLTRDGIATTLLTEAIETKWPGLLSEGWKEKVGVDSKWVEKVAGSIKSKP